MFTVYAINTVSHRLAARYVPVRCVFTLSESGVFQATIGFSIVTRARAGGGLGQDMLPLLLTIQEKAVILRFVLYSRTAQQPQTWRIPTLLWWMTTTTC